MNKNFDLKHFWSTLMTSAIFGAVGTGIFIMLEPHISQGAPHPGPAVLLGNWNLFLALTAFLWISMLVVLLVAERHPRACRSAQKETSSDSKGNRI